MFRPKTLIHLLVCLALILNGVGAAAASVVMTTTSTVASLASETVQQADPQEAAMQSECHEQLSSNPPAVEKGSTDCCKDGGCGCGCVHQSQVVLAAAFLVTPAIAPASIHLEAFIAPQSRSLSRPVRPPIT